jgi:o-succinylbenzoate synthase
MNAWFQKYTLRFKHPSGTSRGVYTMRDSWFVFVNNGLVTGIGECAPLPGLSLESPSRIGAKLLQVCEEIDYFSGASHKLSSWPSIQFGLETALLDLNNGGKKEFFPSAFTRGEAGITINGLIWMGNPESMKQQIRAKLDAGFHCIKVKIGALDFETEFDLLKTIRDDFSADEITLRVDANCAYAYKTAVENLKRLSDLHIHSIEQPIETGHWNEMAGLCRQSPIAIALDEELIGIVSKEEKKKLIETIRPAYLVLKPSLHGGFGGCEEWIELARQNGVGWWITSALESNIGLNAIAQWTFNLDVEQAQGLGTGQLYSNNFDSPLGIKGEKLWINPGQSWDMSNLHPDDQDADF